MEEAPESSSYGQSLVESLAALEVESFLEMLKHVLAARGDFVQPLVSLLVPEIIYPPANILKVRRCVGTIKNYFPDNRRGYISCPEIQEEFQKDAMVYTSQLRDFSVGTRVNFAVCLKENGEPLAYDLHEAKEAVANVMCKFFARGLCNEGTSCRFSHEGVQDAAAAQAGMPCPWFAKGYCNEGDACPLVHDGTVTQRQPTAVQCKYFAKGFCSRGDGCNFLHVQSPGFPSIQASQLMASGVGTFSGQPTVPCRHFAKGHCERGEACNFLHVQSATSPSIQATFAAQGAVHRPQPLVGQLVGDARLNLTQWQRAPGAGVAGAAGAGAAGLKRSFGQGPGQGFEHPVYI